MENPLVNETIDELISNLTNITETASKEIPKQLTFFQKFLANSLLFIGTIIIIFIFILLVILILYCALKYKKRGITKLPDNSITIDNNIEIGSNQGKSAFNFQKISNTSSLSEDHASVNKGSTALSEIRIQNEKDKKEQMQKNVNDDFKTPEETQSKKVKKSRKKSKKDKNANESQEITGSEGSGKKKNNIKTLENDFQKQLEKFGFGEENSYE